MLSIVTAVHNALSMNRLYWKALSENTTVPFELIVIDNHSTDGTEAFFAELTRSCTADKRVIHVRNDYNQLYAPSQNQGVEFASFDILCFLNNDIWLPRGWNEPFQRALQADSLLVLSPSGQEAQPRQTASDRLKTKWKHRRFLAKVWQRVFLKSEEDALWKSLQWMYGDLANFKSPTDTSEPYFHGIKGDAVVLHRDLKKILGVLWDERIEASDWHLYLTMARLHEKDPSIPLPRVLTDVYVHHFGRYSGRMKYETPRKPVPTVDLSALWSSADIDRLWWGNQLPA